MIRNVFLLTLCLFMSCSKSNNEPNSNSLVFSGENLDNYQDSTDILMQAFYWDVEPRGDWWNVINGKLDNWKKTGISQIWLPPLSKGQSGGYSMGYDPMDYFDFGDLNQMGTTETRFGSRQELENLIGLAHQKNLKVIADMVLNHNSGGDIEFNIFRNEDTYTHFSPKSGLFPRDFNCFHPNSIHNNDSEAGFYPKQDLCHDQPDVQNWLWKAENSVAKYYKNTLKIDGWRFDYVKGYAPWVIKEWLAAVGGFSVGEFWDSNATTLNDWVAASNSAAFDFAAFYALENAFDGANLTLLKTRDMLLKRNPNLAVTFVSNHDTEKDSNENNKITNKTLAYAYIFTHEGTPCVFYSDYENNVNKTKIEKLIKIKKSLAKGNTEVLFYSQDVYIAKRTGNAQTPGLIVFLNNSNVAKTQSVGTKWKNATLVDYSENSLKTLNTDASGNVLLEAPAKGYTIWSLQKFK